jgi:[acyl-carrier-protein] S-malonyltransferase
MELDGEHLDVYERVVISPASGVFMPADRTDGPVRPGDTLGHVLCSDGLVAVSSPFRGDVVEVVALRGERVQCHERIAWLRTVA